MMLVIMIVLTIRTDPFIHHHANDDTVGVSMLQDDIPINLIELARR